MEGIDHRGAGLALVLMAALLGAGCGSAGKGAQVLRLRRVEGTIEVATDAEAPLETTDTDKGIEVLSKGGLLRLPAGTWVRFELLHRKGIYHLFGPAEVELVEASLVKSGGIHAKPKEVAATLHLSYGVFAAAFEGSAEDRPLLEVRTPRASTVVQETDKVAVLVEEGDEWREAWVRGERGPALNLLLEGSGETLAWPLNGVALFEQGKPMDAESVDATDKGFTRALIEPMIAEEPRLRELDRLFYDLSWLEISHP